MVTSASAEAQPRPRAATRPGVRRLGWAFVAGWTVWLACAFIYGERASTLAALEAQVAAGDVRTVRVSEGLSSNGQGFSVVEVHWRQGIRSYTTEVIEARPRQAGREAAREGVTAVINEDLGVRLEELRPDIRVDRVDRTSGLVTDAFGWHFTGWIAGALVAGYLCILGLLIYGPEPRRATRWAWFWLISVAVPVTAIAFLVLGGTTSRGPAPVDRSRLTGGWAFLLATVIAAAFASGN